MDVRLLGKKNEGEGLGVAVLVDSAFAELKDKSDEQLAEAQRFLIQDFSLLAAKRPALNHPLRGWRQTALQSHPSDRY